MRASEANLLDPARFAGNNSQATGGTSRSMSAMIARSPGSAAVVSGGASSRIYSLLLLYLVLSRVGGDSFTKIGLHLGPLPFFVTDLVLIAAALLTFFTQPARLAFWASGGHGTGPIGRAVWLLCIASAVYCAEALPEYRVFAIRDLAIFGYSIFFPLTYMAIRHRQDAAKIIKYSTYSGVVLAAALVIQATTGLQLGLGISQREVLGQTVSDLGGGDVGGVIAFSTAALLAYIAYDHQRRALHTGLLLVCLLALVANTTRAALVGLLLAAALIFVLGELRQKAVIGWALAPLALVVAAGAAGALPGFLQAFYVAGLSGMSGPAVDPTAAFRMVRWHYAWQLWLSHPLFGLGFGRLLLPYSLDSQNFGEGFFNGGMPHNTFLFLLARMGLVGFGLVAYCWVATIALLAKRVSRRPDADQMAAASILVAMMGFAFFVLFFERPVNGSAFWIILAAGLRLLPPEPSTAINLRPAFTRRLSSEAVTASH